MKGLIDQVEDGIESFLGERVMVYCMNYHYCGKLVGVGEKTLKLEECFMVFDTGQFNEEGWDDAQQLPGPHHFVERQAVESFGFECSKDNLHD